METPARGEVRAAVAARVLFWLLTSDSLVQYASERLAINVVRPVALLERTK